MSDNGGGIVLKVDSTQVERGEKRLDALADAADRAGSAQKSLSEASQKASDRLKQVGVDAVARAQALRDEITQNRSLGSVRQRNADGLKQLAAQQTEFMRSGMQAAQAATKTTQSTELATKAAEKQRAELGRLLGDIDPVTKALGRLDEQERKLFSAKRSGAIDNDTFTQYQTRLEQTRRELGRFEGAQNKAGLTAKQLANNMRMVPAQLTDITVSLLTGQRPITVLLQQGGQLKDMFGGVGMAAKALGGYVLSLINPFTVAAAAVGVLAFAYYKGQKEMEVFNIAVARTGNMAGITSRQLSDMSREVGKSVGSVGAAAEVLAKMAASGRIHKDVMADATKAAIEWSRASGDSVDTVVANYIKIGEAPTQAILKLNETMGFLDAATYNRIKRLEEQGNKEDAAKLATQEYTRAIQSSAKNVNESAGTLTNTWNALAGAARGAWDSMLNIGRPTPTSELEAQRKALEGQIESLNKSAQTAPTVSWWGGSGKMDLAAQARNQASALQKELTGISAELDKRAAAEKTAEKNRADALVEQEKISAQGRVDSLKKSISSRAEMRAQEIQKIRKDAKTLGLTQKELDSLISGINEKWKDTGGGGSGLSVAETMLRNAKEQQASLQQQLETTDKLTNAQMQLAKFEQTIADIRANSNRKAGDKSLLVAESEIRKTLELNAALEKQLIRKKELQSLDALQAQTAAAAATDRQGYESSLSLYGISGRRAEQLQAELRMQQEHNRQMMQLQRDLARGMISDASYKEQTSVLSASLQVRLAMQADYYDQLGRLDSSFRAGTTAALNNYAELNKNLAGAVQGWWGSTLDSFSANVIDAMSGATVSVKNFASEAIKQLARITLQTQVLGPLAGLLGNAVGSLFGPATAPAGVTPGLNWTFAGPRAGGGQTRSGHFYEVNEHQPELLDVNGKTFLMMGAGDGYVTPPSSSSVSPGGGSVGGVVVQASTVFNVIMNGDGSAPDVVEMERSGDAIGQAMSAAVRVEVGQMMLPGGELWNWQQGIR